MKQTARKASTALLAATFMFGIPLGGFSQTTMTGNQQTVMLRSALAHFDTETQMLATMKNQIPSSEIIPVAITGLGINAPERRDLTRAMSGSRHAALQAALAKATVADVDRNNGQSPDQSSLAEYLQHLRIDPNSVVAVNIDPKDDPQNPHVTIFYRK